ncbi:EscU/YscU/HrcU family type III secretion system export apparatus switch protein [Varunaivibrio sulfuroxidans]|uniref:EscU/YscU/HrcU family type III secretion system export apparatus switch protein n=1 Tax=Varunaivibrio sulfuroxidans TaxID=1773489 RepID=UPI002AC32BB6|nr:EscU/YscU/HrcU family type III secretion system export apparatus switch protein [Varunaivibrio sulfuroxidans]
MSRPNDRTPPRQDAPKGAPEDVRADASAGALKDAIAVALKYDPGDARAPKVVAGGRGHIAEQILQIAFDRGIKVRKDADLAQILSVIDIDSEIPLEAFAAVAEILVYVYRANDRLDELEGGPSARDAAGNIDGARQNDDEGKTSPRRKDEQ